MFNGIMDHQVATRIVFGSEVIKRAGSLIKEYGKCALVVMTEDIYFSKLENILKSSGIKAIPYVDVTPNPRDTEIDSGAELAKKEGCDIVIGLGGGSAMDAAKGIAVAASHQGTVWNYVSKGEPEDQEVTAATLPIITIPTTSGTGSQITPFAVISNKKTKEKPAIVSPNIFAKIAICDPDLMKSMPTDITASTGFDVLTHSLESFVNTNATPLSDLYSAKSIQQVGLWLKRAVKDGSDMQARIGMAWGDLLAGFAQDTAGVTIPHALAHAISGHFDTTHGKALSVITPASMYHSYKYNLPKYAAACELLGPPLELSEEEKAFETIKRVKQLISDIGLPQTFKELGIKLSKTNLEQIAEDALKYMKGCIDADPNPANQEALIKILKRSC